MSATMKGGLDLSALIASLPEKLERNILRGAMRAGAEVIADDARARCTSDEVRATIGTSSRVDPGVVSAKVRTRGKGAYKAPWLENGTDPHLISIDTADSGGRTVRRVNNLAKKGTLVINGKAVGATVEHPGAKPSPFMRTALDAKEQDAVTAIGSYIAARLTKEGLAAPSINEPEDDE